MDRKSTSGVEYWESSSVVSSYSWSPFLFRGEEQALLSHYPNGLQGLRVLDLGCGTGRVGCVISEMGAEVVGIDLSKNLISVARERSGNVEFFVADAVSLPIENASFDLVIFSYNGLDYIYPRHDRMQAVSEIARVLRPDGLFILSNHNAAAFLFGLRGFLRPSMLLFRVKQILCRNAFKADCYVSDIAHPKNMKVYYGWPNKIVADMGKMGFKLKSIHPNFSYTEKIQNALRITLFSRLTETWPYYVFQKKTADVAP